MSKFKVGDTVRHKKFGKTFTIIYIYKDGRYCVLQDSKNLLKYVYLFETMEDRFELCQEQPVQQTLPIQQTTCTHPRKYHNKVFSSFMIWVCPDCKQEV